ncbi:hypothetical protein RCL1_000563 [Eukaryota sp. TZLM3-RCL]
MTSPFSGVSMNPLHAVVQHQHSHPGHSDFVHPSTSSLTPSSFIPASIHTPITLPTYTPNTIHSIGIRPSSNSPNHTFSGYSSSGSHFHEKVSILKDHFDRKCVAIIVFVLIIFFSVLYAAPWVDLSSMRQMERAIRQNDWTNLQIHNKYNREQRHEVVQREVKKLQDQINDDSLSILLVQNAQNSSIFGVYMTQKRKSGSVGIIASFDYTDEGAIHYFNQKLSDQSFIGLIVHDLTVFDRKVKVILDNFELLSLDFDLIYDRLEYTGTGHAVIFFNRGSLQSSITFTPTFTLSTQGNQLISAAQNVDNFDWSSMVTHSLVNQTALQMSILTVGQSISDLVVDATPIDLLSSWDVVVELTIAINDVISRVIRIAPVFTLSEDGEAVYHAKSTVENNPITTLLIDDPDYESFKELSVKNHLMSLIDDSSLSVFVSITPSNTVNFDFLITVTRNQAVVTLPVGVDSFELSDVGHEVLVNRRLQSFLTASPRLIVVEDRWDVYEHMEQVEIEFLKVVNDVSLSIDFDSPFVVITLTSGPKFVTKILDDFEFLTKSMVDVKNSYKILAASSFTNFSVDYNDDTDEKIFLILNRCVALITVDVDIEVSRSTIDPQNFLVNISSVDFYQILIITPTFNVVDYSDLLLSLRREILASPFNCLGVDDLNNTVDRWDAVQQRLSAFVDAHKVLVTTSPGTIYRSYNVILSRGEYTNSFTMLSSSFTFTSNVFASSSHDVIVSGRQHTAIWSPSSLFLHGNGVQGQLAHGAGNQFNSFFLFNYTTPTLFSTTAFTQPIIEVAIGFDHTLFLTQDGLVYGAGSNENGVLDGTTQTQDRHLSTPRLINGISNVLHVYAGYRFSYALTHTETLYSWGLNNNGQLGVGDLSIRRTPTEIFGYHVTMAAAGFTHGCFLSDEKQVYCFGRNYYKEVGNVNGRVNSPRLVTGLPSNVLKIVVGEYFSMVLLDDGNVYGWGYDNLGMLCLGSSTDGKSPPYQRLTPTKSLLSGVADLATGRVHTLALLNNGSILGCGYNDKSQLGNLPGTVSGTIRTPVLVHRHSCTALSSSWESGFCKAGDGYWYGWGDNPFYVLGDGSTVRRPSPVPVGCSA